MYRKIARYYDLLGWEEFHEISWAYLQPLLRKNKARSYLDMACGTGTLAFTVARKGIDVVGIDKSKEMLAQVETRLRMMRSTPKPQFFKRDMTRFNLRRKFEAVGCFFDAVSHVLTEEGVCRLMKNAADHLEPGGFFIFDVNTAAGMRKWDAILLSKRGQHSLLMKGDYDRYSRLARITIKGYVELGNSKRDRFSETFYERAYPHVEIVRFLKMAGFRKITASPDKKGRNLRQSLRVFYTAYK